MFCCARSVVIQIVHGGSAIGENLIEDKDLLGTFGKLIQCKYNH